MTRNHETAANPTRRNISRGVGFEGSNHCRPQTASWLRAAQYIRSAAGNDSSSPGRRCRRAGGRGRGAERLMQRDGRDTAVAGSLPLPFQRRGDVGGGANHGVRRVASNGGCHTGCARVVTVEQPSIRVGDEFLNQARLSRAIGRLVDQQCAGRRRGLNVTADLSDCHLDTGCGRRVLDSFADLGRAASAVDRIPDGRPVHVAKRHTGNHRCACRH